MPNAEVNGTELAYEIVAEGPLNPMDRPPGPLCLVLHGWPGTDHTYLRPALDRLAPPLRLVYYDHRGHGRSGRSPIDALSVEQLADDAAALAAHLSADPVLVLGHAHGASVAQELAVRHPARVAGLVLVSATPGELGSRESLADTLDAPLIPPEAEILQRVPPETDDEWAATMQALAPFFLAKGEAGDAGPVFARTIFAADGARRWMQALGWWSVVDRLGEVDAPALLLVGRHDVFCPPSQSERIGRQLRRAETVVLEGGGHLPWLEEADSFVGSVRAWLDRSG